MEHQSTLDRSFPPEPRETPLSQRGGREGLEKAGAYAQSALDQTRETVSQATGYVQDAVGQARVKMAGYGQAGLDRVKGDVVDYTRQQPVTALLIAAGAGLVLGMMAGIARR
jgi:ElaB/YqjD/DUF883 family membrane-anchored ribosome-binding protein